MILVVVVAVVLSVPCLLLLYKKIRPLFSVKVTCWFCGSKTVVPYGNFNCWDCPRCEQYNGFREDGDYNKPIPAQFDESLNFVLSASHSPDQSASLVQMERENGLCSTCNYHQLIKVRLLSNFVPTDEAHFDSESELYRRRLEETYSLCHTCQERLHQKLTLQDRLLRPQLAEWMSTRVPNNWRCTAGLRGHFVYSLLVVTSLLCLLDSLCLLMCLLDSWVLPSIGPSGWDLSSIGHRRPSPVLLRLAGMLLAAGSVLFAGIQRFGRLEMVLCWFWLLVVITGTPWMTLAMDNQQLHWLQVALTSVTAILCAARTVAIVMERRAPRFAFRKLGRKSEEGTVISSSDASLGSLASSLSKPDWETGSSASQPASSVPCSAPSLAPEQPLEDRIGSVHISTKGELSWSTGWVSAPSCKSPIGAGPPSISSRSTSLVWPPRFRPFAGEVPCASGGAWDVGDRSFFPKASGSIMTRNKSKQPFGVLTLTPPPSRAGSTANGSTVSGSVGKQTNRSAVGEGHFHNSPKSYSFIGATTTQHVPAPPSQFGDGRSFVGKMPDVPSLRRRTCGRHDDTAKRSLAGSSVSEGFSEPGTPTSVGSRIHKRQAYSPYSCAILVLSFGLNLALLAYFVVLPASNTVTR